MTKTLLKFPNSNKNGEFVLFIRKLDLYNFSVQSVLYNIR